MLSNKPSFPARISQLIRGTSGNVRMVGPNQAAQVVDVEFSVPDFYLVTAQSDRPALFRLEIGVERAQMSFEEVTTDFIVRIVEARSIALTMRDIAGGATTPTKVKSIVVPIDPSITDIQKLQISMGINDTFGILDPFVVGSLTTIINTPVDVVSQSLTDFVVTSQGWIVTNFSPAGRTLYLKMDASAAAIAASGYSVIVPPGGVFYTQPFLYTGRMTGIWDGADAAGYANVTAVI
jgi:hypothetical protein